MPINPLFVALALAHTSGGAAAAGAPPVPRRIGRGLRRGRATRKPGRFAGPDDPGRVRCRRCKAERGANCDPRTLGRHAFHRVRVEDAKAEAKSRRQRSQSDTSRAELRDPRVDPRAGDIVRSSGLCDWHVVAIDRHLQEVVFREDADPRQDRMSLRTWAVVTEEDTVICVAGLGVGTGGAAGLP